jgi:hypothetical protein
MVSSRSTRMWTGWGQEFDRPVAQHGPRQHPRSLQDLKPLQIPSTVPLGRKAFTAPMTAEKRAMAPVRR